MMNTQQHIHFQFFFFCTLATNGRISYILISSHCSVAVTSTILKHKISEITKYIDKNTYFILIYLVVELEEK